MKASELFIWLLDNTHPDDEVYIQRADGFDAEIDLQVQPGNVVVEGGITTVNNRTDNVIVIR